MRKIIKTQTNKKKLSATGNSLLRLSKLKFRGGPKDLSARMDYYLYDEPYKNK